MAGEIHPCSAPDLEFADKISCYCERAGNAEFWAEPLNAVSNISFFIAAYFAWRALQKSGIREGRWPIVFLIVATVAVGTGSFLFHTLATVWAMFADVIPIGIIIFTFFILALRWFLHWPFAGALAGGLVVVVAMFSLPPWFNGSMLYFPPILAVTLIGVVLLIRGSPIGLTVFTGALVFYVSIFFRTIDRLPEVCGHITAGTHLLWHLLNGLGIFILITSVIKFREFKESRDAPAEVSGAPES